MIPSTPQDKPIDLEALRLAAEAATPGPWFSADWSDDFGDNKTTIEAHSEEVLSPGCSSIWPGGIRCKRIADTEEGDSPIADAAYIAAWNPATALDLLALIDAQQKKIAERDAVLEDAALMADYDRKRNVDAATENNGRQSDFAFGRVAAAEGIAANIRALKSPKSVQP